MPRPLAEIEYTRSSHDGERVERDTLEGWIRDNLDDDGFEREICKLRGVVALLLAHLLDAKPEILPQVVESLDGYPGYDHRLVPPE